jgi:hypothetical protein
LYSTEFSDVYPALALIFTLFFSIWLAIKNRHIRFLILLIWASILFEIVFANLIFDPTGRPGMRRNTSLLAFIYTLYTICWYYVFVKYEAKFSRILCLFLLLLIPLHHLWVFPGNASHLKDRSPDRYVHFAIVDNSFQKTLNRLVAAAQEQELWLSCKDSTGNPVQCRYVEIYAAVAGSCYWNHLNCQSIKGYDNKSGNFIYLNPDLWRSYYWSH